MQKLAMLGLNSSLCYWVLVFLTNRVQPVKIKTSSSSPIIFSTGAPQGAVPSLLLFILLTCDCSAKHQSCHIVKFADVVGCIISNDECDCRQEVERLESCCRDKSLCINVKKTNYLFTSYNYPEISIKKNPLNPCTAWLCYDRRLAIFYNISGALTG